MDLRANVLSVCAGGGALDIGVRLALPAARVVCYVEIEAYACDILVSRMEEGRLDAAPLWTDLRTFDGKPWRGRVDWIIGGYPCQPFSVAGRMQGKNDPRHLWPVIRDLIDVVRPQGCFFENVSNHLRLGFEEVADDLRQMGYRTAATLITAEEVGATHKRERLFIMARRDMVDAASDVQRDWSEGADAVRTGREYQQGLAGGSGARDALAYA